MKKSLYESVIIVRDTDAVIYQLATETAYRTTLKKGHRFDQISGIEDGDELSLLIEPTTGTLWGIPSDCFFPLTSRFDRDSA